MSEDDYHKQREKNRQMEEERELTKSEENYLLRRELEKMCMKMEMFEEEGMDLLEFNRELQWTLV
jgi:hypothetical protein